MVKKKRLTKLQKLKTKPTASDHQESINAFIPIAESRALEKIKKDYGIKYEHRTGTDGNPHNWSFFTEYFHREMDALTTKAGLRIK